MDEFESTKHGRESAREFGRQRVLVHVSDLQELQAKADAFDKLKEIIDNSETIKLVKMQKYHLYKNGLHIDEGESLPEAIAKVYNSLQNNNLK